MNLTYKKIVHEYSMRIYIYYCEFLYSFQLFLFSYKHIKSFYFIFIETCFLISFY